MDTAKPLNLAELQEMARRIRVHVLSMIAGSQAGHPGGSLSCVDVLTALYFGGILNVDPCDPKKVDRDRFILSKGHASPALYAALAERGYFSVDILPTFDQIGSLLQGHPDMKLTPGIDMSTGSLGQGLSAGLGMALAARLEGLPSRVFVLLGDGECQEGQVWEAAMVATHQRATNLTAIVDNNRIQLLGPLQEIVAIEPLAPRWRSFGWRVLEVDGHDFAQLLTALKTPVDSEGRPTVIIAHTVKGKGVSFMENTAAWHSKPPSQEQLALALAELGGAEKWGLAS